MYDSKNMYEVLAQVAGERARQEELKDAGKFLWTCSDLAFLIPGQPEGREDTENVNNPEKFAVLGEEFGEVAMEVTEEIIAESKGLPTAEIRRKLRKELIQVAAVCVAWAEALTREGVKP